MRVYSLRNENRFGMRMNPTRSPFTKILFHLKVPPTNSAFRGKLHHFSSHSFEGVDFSSSTVGNASGVAGSPITNTAAWQKYEENYFLALAFSLWGKQWLLQEQVNTCSQQTKPKRQRSSFIPSCHTETSKYLTSRYHTNTKRYKKDTENEQNREATAPLIRREIRKQAQHNTPTPKDARI